MRERVTSNGSPPTAAAACPWRGFGMLGRWTVVAPTALATLLVLTACRTAPSVPEQHWPGTRAALQTLADRAATVESLSARCDMAIQTPENGTVSLDGAMVLAAPDRMRVQAWKFDQRVFDLTMRDGGVWLWADERAGDVRNHFPAGGGASGAGAVWLGPLIEPVDPDLATVIEDDPAGGTLTVRYPIGDNADGWSWIAEIDRATITYRELRVHDPQQRVVQRLRLTDYAMLGDPQLGGKPLPWPMRLTARGRINAELSLSDVELNPDLPDAAFEPPARAQPIE